MIKTIIFSSLVLAVSFAERISITPDVSWNRSPSSLSRDNSFSSSGSAVSDRDRFPITGGSPASSVNSRSPSSAGSGTFGFDQDSSSSGGSRFPVTGDSPSGSRSVSSGSGSRVGGSQFGSSAGSGPRGSGSGSFSATTPDPTKNYYVRIVASLIKLTNDKSLTSTGSSCAVFGKCDPIVLADLDTERPNANWPGARDSKTWSQIYVGKSQDSFDIKVDNITKDICGQNYREADLRVRVEDKKKLTSNAIINEFDCPINRVPDESSLSADWSPVVNCIPRFPAGKQTLTMRYKVYYVSRFSCGLSQSVTTTTSRSIFG